MVRWLISLCLLVTSSYAIASDDQLNQAAVKVKDHTPAVFQQALKTGFATVLSKMSGNPAIMTVPRIQNSLPSINNYIDSYTYTENKDPATGQVQLYLQVTFDEKSVKQLLQEAKQAIWKNERPTTLIILSVSNAQGRQILASDSNDPLIAAFNNLAHERGIKIIWPVMDLEDQTDIGDMNSTQLPNEILQKLAARYHVSSVLFGLFNNTETRLQASWRWWLNNAITQWSSENENRQTAVTDGFNQLMENLASQFSTVSNDRTESEVTVKFSGVNGLSDYTQLMAVVRQLTPVSAAEVKSLYAEDLTLQIKVAGGLEALNQALRTSPQFREESQSIEQSDNAINLFFHWVGPTQQAMNTSISQPIN